MPLPARRAPRDPTEKDTLSSNYKTQTLPHPAEPYLAQYTKNGNTRTSASTASTVLQPLHKNSLASGPTGKNRETASTAENATSNGVAVAHTKTSLANFDDDDCIEKLDNNAVVNLDDQPGDYYSVRGVFGWATIDDTNIPYILRKTVKFVAVRIVEKTMLNRYPKLIIDEVSKKGPLSSYFISHAEAKLLNEINIVHCNFQFGSEPFTTKDLVVILREFKAFFELLKRTCPTETDLPSKTNGNIKFRPYGWMQINNTVVPYVVRSNEKLVPLSIIVYAAHLLTPDEVEGLTLDPTDEEISWMNTLCLREGFGKDSFGKRLKLIHILEIVKKKQVIITELPFDKPMEHAQYMESIQQVQEAGRTLPPTQLPPFISVGPTNLPYRSGPSIHDPISASHNPILGPMMTVPRTLPLRSLGVPTTSSAKSMPSVSTSGALLHLVSTQTAPIVCAPPPTVCNITSTPQVSTSRTIGDQLNVLLQSLPVRPTRPPQTSTNGTNSAQRNTVPLQSLPVSLQASYPRSVLPPHTSVAGGHIYVHSSSASLPNGYAKSSTHVPLQDNFNVGPTNQIPLTPIVTSRMTPIVPGVHGEEMRAAAHIFGEFPKPGHPGGVGSLTDSVVHPMQSSQLASQARFPVQPAITMKMPSPLAVTSVVPGTLSWANQNNTSCGNNSTYSGKAGLEDDLTVDELVGCISPMIVEQKSISCLRRNSNFRKGVFCLLEAVAKLYFPITKITDLINGLKNGLRLKLYECSKQEAEAFIRFYKLSVTSLHENTMIDLVDLITFLPQIYYMFPQNTASAPVPVVASGITIRRSSGTRRLASPSNPIHVVLNNNSPTEIVNVDSEPSPTGNGSNIAGRKRRREQQQQEQGQDETDGAHRPTLSFSSGPSCGPSEEKRTEPSETNRLTKGQQVIVINDDDD